MNSPDAADQNVELWRAKQLVKKLGTARGEGTSLITLILSPKASLSLARNNLKAEYGTASNIKSHVNKVSVLSAIKTTQQRLKLFKELPPNGLVVYAGTILTGDGKEKKISEHIIPPKPIGTSLYRCGNQFYTQALVDLLASDSKKFGFIVMDGNGTLFGTLEGNTRTVLRRFTVDLPKKHGRGGQSALRFSRLRDEKRHNYVRKVSEFAVEHFIADNKANVTGLVLAGSADFKNELSESNLFDKRLAETIIKVVDVSYGGENGFHQAIDLAADSLSNVKYVQETKLLQRYFDEISLDTGKYCYGIDDTLKGLEMGAVELLIVWEDLDLTRYTLRNAAGVEIIEHLSGEDEKSKEKLVDPLTGRELEQTAEPSRLLDWFADNYKKFGASLELVTDCSHEGAKFVKGFGGVGGILRYKVDFASLDAFDENDDEFYSETEDEDV